MIDHLSPREVEELAAAAAAGDALPRVIAAFTEGTRLRLGWDCAMDEAQLRRAASAGESMADLMARAGRWAAERGLHLMSFAGAGPGEEPLGDRRWFMAVG